MLAESEIMHVLDALCGCPTVTTPEFADRVEKILRGGSSGKEPDNAPCLTGLDAYGEVCSVEELEILAKREPYHGRAARDHKSPCRKTFPV